MRVVPLGFACNNACVFCAQGALRARAPGVDSADPVAHIEALLPGEAVAFVGGEPTLRAELPAWIRAADARGAARVIVQTNGRRLAYRGYAAALGAASQRLSLDVSLHGSSAPMHDYHTSAPGSFGQTLKGLSNVRAAGIPFVITTVVTRSNFRHLTEITRLAGALGARALQLFIAAPHGSAARAADRVIPTAELVAPHLTRALAEAASIGLGWRAGERMSAPDVASWFAGLGAIDDVAADPHPGAYAAPFADGKRHLTLAALGRPAPGRSERHAPVRRTGEALRPLFPSLFQAASSDVGGEPAFAPPSSDIGPGSGGS